MADEIDRKQIYQELGQHIKINKDDGEFDIQYLNDLGIDDPGQTDRQGAIDTFNQAAQIKGVNPLRDPTGYMTQDDSVYDNLHTSYQNAYTDAYNNAINHVIRGGGYAEQAQLNNLNKVIWRDAKMFLPKEIKYSDLRFVKASNEEKKAINEMAQKRTILTNDRTIKRTLRKQNSDTFKRDSEAFQAAGRNVARLVAQDYGVKMELPKMSSKTLLANGKGDQESLDKFKQQLADPAEITVDDTGIPTAHFEIDKKDRNFGRFIAGNRKYLKDYGFETKKAKGKMVVSWTSQQVQKLYNERQQMSLDLSDFKDQSQTKGTGQSQ